jgi:aryl-alcohol dehydrogenase-like predicted oxidoreductase
MASRLNAVLGALALGGMNLAEDEACLPLLDHFFSKGWHEIDTALMYADGKSEQVLGRYLKDRKPSKVSLPPHDTRKGTY